MASDGVPSSSGLSKVEKMMEDLGLREEDLDDVVFDEKDAPAEEDLRWMILVRVYMDKDFSNYWFFRNMRVAWDLAQEVKFRPLEENLYTLQKNTLP